MTLLGVRKIQILQAIVLDYVATTKPVGSERLLEIQTLNCKSATIRNEMAELSEWGYLMQPHTSSGRIPTDRGYRYYVDELMNPPAALGLEEADDARQNARKMQNDLEEILLQTCRVLTGLTSYPSLATDPVLETTSLQRIFLTEASPRHALLVATLSTGHVAHRLVELESAPGDSALVRMANFVNAQAGERELGEASRLLSALEVPVELTAHAAALAKITAALLQVVQGLSERRVFLEGVNQIFRQPEFQDVERLTSLMQALEQPGALRQMLFDAQYACDVTVMIGSENAYAPMQECSVIASPYRIGDRMAGCLGVVGPTRMNYDRATAAVGLMAQNLSTMLTNLSLA